MPRLVVFDWDGTLMDSLGAMVACARHALRDIGVEPPASKVIRSAIGLGLEDVMARLAPGMPNDQRRQMADRYRTLWLSSYHRRNLLFEGARAALEALAGHDLLLAVATGKSRAGLDADLESTGIGPFFLTTRTADDAPSKPHPAMLLAILDELGVDTADALMVGDTTFDLDMARAAGVRAVAVTSGGHDTETLRSRAPVACLDTVEDLPDWLGRYRSTSP